MHQKLVCRMISRALLFGFCAGLLPVQAETHIALVGASRLPRELAAIELAEVLLSAAPDLVLVDRHKVAELLTEQNLSRLGALQAQHAIRVGQVFNVSLFAVLEATEKDDVLWYANVFDAHSGEMLIKTPIPVDKDLSVSAEAMTRVVKMAVEKHLVPKSERKTITIMAIRNADLGGMWDAWCQGIESLLENTILDIPSATLLNRRHLEWVNRESALQGIAAELMATYVRLSVEISRDTATGGIRIELRAEDQAGIALLEHGFSRTDMDAAGIVAAVGAELRAWMQAEEVVAQPAAVDRQAEAFKHIADADYFLHVVQTAGREWDETREPAKAVDFQNGVKEVHRATEAAIATAPHDFQVIYNAYRFFSIRGIDEEDPTSLHSYWRAIEMWKQYGLQTTQKGEPLHGRAQEIMAIMLRILREYHARTRAIRDPARQAAVDMAIEEARLRFEDWALEFVMEHYYARGPSINKDNTELSIRVLLPNMFLFRPQARVWRLVTEGYPVLFDLLEKDAISTGWVRNHSRLFAQLAALASGHKPIFYHTFRLQWGFPAHPYPYDDYFMVTDAHLLSLQPIFQRMIDHPDPVVEVYGLIGELALDKRFKGLQGDALYQRMLQVRDILRKDMVSPRKKPHIRYQGAAYAAERDMIDLFIEDQHEREAWHYEQFEFMRENRHVEYGATMFAIHPEFVRFRNYLGSEAADHFKDLHIQIFPFEMIRYPKEDYAVRVDRIRQILALLDEDDVTKIELGLHSFKHGSFKMEVDAVLRRIYKTRPDLQAGTRLTWKRADILYPFKRGSDRILAVAGIRDKFLYAVAQEGWSDPTVYVVRIPLDGSAPQRWGKPMTRKEGWRAPYHATLGGSGGVLFAAGDALVHFPSQNSAPVLWTPESGYPTANITSAAEVNNTLVISLVGGYTLGRRPADPTWQLIVSSRRATPVSKLDTIRHSVPMIAQVNGMNYAFLVVQSQRYGVNRRDGIDGIWSVDTDTLEIQQVLTLTRRIYGWNQLDTGHIILHARRLDDRSFFSDSYAEYGIVRFDPFTGNADVTHQMGGNKRGLGENLPRTKDTNEFVFTSTTSITLAQDYLWVGLWIINDRREILNVPPFEKKHTGVAIRGLFGDGSADIPSAYIPVPGTRAVVAVGPDCRKIYYLEVQE